MNLSLDCFAKSPIPTETPSRAVARPVPEKTLRQAGLDLHEPQPSVWITGRSPTSGPCIETGPPPAPGWWNNPPLSRCTSQQHELSGHVGGGAGD